MSEHPAAGLFDVTLRVDCEACALLIMNDIAARFRGLRSVALTRAEDPPGQFVALLSARATFWPGSKPCEKHAGVLRDPVKDSPVEPPARGAR